MKCPSSVKALQQLLQAVSLPSSALAFSSLSAHVAATRSLAPHLRCWVGFFYPHYYTVLSAYSFYEHLLKY